jgi:transposase
MTTHPLIKTVPESQPALFAGIDVGAEELILVIRQNGKSFDPQKFANTLADRARLVKKLVKLPGLIVCLEATGIYHFDLALAYAATPLPLPQSQLRVLTAPHLLGSLWPPGFWILKE